MSETPVRSRALRRSGYALAGIGGALLIALLIYGLLVRAPNRTIDDRLAHARAVRAPAFELPVLSRGRIGTALPRRIASALSSGRLSLGELRGTPVILNLWASWCDPCRAEATVLQHAWSGEARQRGVLLLGLDSQDITSDASDFLHQFHIDYPTLRDADNTVGRRYGITGIPETFFLDRRGRIIGHIIGPASRGALHAGITAARNGEIARTTKGGPQGVLR